MLLAVLFLSTFAGAARRRDRRPGLRPVDRQQRRGQRLPARRGWDGPLRARGVLPRRGDAGPALIGAVLAVRQATGAAALNPLYGFGAAPYADAFLAMGLALAAALVVAFGLQTTPATSAASRQPGRDDTEGMRGPLRISRRRPVGFQPRV
jgi:hypothetical protein